MVGRGKNGVRLLEIIVDMNIIQPQISYSSRRISSLLKQILVAFLLLVFSMVLWLIVHLNNLGKQWQVILVIFGYAAIICSLFLIRHKYLDELVNQLFGKRGEDAVANILMKDLDDSYSYIRNLEIPNKGGDIDGILVGPTGVWILEVKNYSGVFEIINGEFIKVYKEKRVTLWKNPIRQVLKQKSFLSTIFETKGIKSHIRPLVVMAHGRISIQGSTHVYVLEKEKLVNFIKDQPNSLLDSKENILKQLI
jgi:hypothetical protein